MTSSKRVWGHAAAGFSLLEVLCALAILSFGLAAMVEGITMSLRASQEAERYSAAALLAAERVEILRAEGYLCAGEEEGEFTGAMSGYRWRQRVTETALDGLYHVQVAIEHTGAVGAAAGEVVYELDTLLFEVPFESSYEKSELRERERELRARGYTSGAGGAR